MKRLANHLRGFAAIVLTMAVLSTSGRSVSYNEAVKIASDFFSSQGIDSAPAAMRRVKAPGLNNDVVSPYYIINTDKSFAVVSGDSRVAPILAYSLDETFDPDNIAPGAQYMLDGYAEYINVVANDETDHVKYIFNATDSEVGFYLANGETVDAGKAYLRIPGSPLNAPLRFTLYSTGGTTGIFVVADDSATGSEIYNMQGVKVLRPTDGVYIINGKKVFIKK